MPGAAWPDLFHFDTINETIKSRGPFTVFAPTDEACAKVPKTVLENLLKDKEQLMKVILYHVFTGKLMSADVVILRSAKSVGGSSAVISVNDRTVMVNEAHVLAVDIESTNGVIHVIDSMLMPPTPTGKMDQ